MRWGDIRDPRCVDEAPASYVDTVDGFVKAAMAEGIEGAMIQLGTGQAMSIGELFTMCCEAVGIQAEVRQDPRRMRPAAGEVLVLESEPSMARECLGWEPQTPLIEGLRRIPDWIRSHGTGRAGAFLHQKGIRPCAAS